MSTGWLETDDRDWLDGLWRASDQYEPERRKMSKQDIVEMVEKCNGRISNRQLLRVVLLNGLNLGDYHLLSRYCAELRREYDEDKPRRSAVPSTPDQPSLPFEDPPI